MLAKETTADDGPPFKPFSLDEVKAVTGVAPGVLDAWVRAVLKIQLGCATFGLDYMQTFGVYAGWRYLEEGAPRGRPEAVVHFVASLPHPTLLDELARGNSFPCLKGVDPSVPASVLVRAPSGPLGRRLNLKTLYDEFRTRLTRVFPPDKEPRP